MSEPALELRSYGVAFGDQTILADIDLSIPRKGMTVLLGPPGAGKSTLLRTLAGQNDANPSLHTSGEIRYPSTSGEVTAQRPQLVMQKARFFVDTVRENLAAALPDRSNLDRATQTALIREHLERNRLGGLIDKLDSEVIDLDIGLQRRLAIVRALLGDPPILFADETTTSIPDDHVDEIIAMLRAQAKYRAVVYVTHNQRHAAAVGGTAVLLVAGRIREVAPTMDFLQRPKTDVGKQFLRTGNSYLPAPDADPDTLDEDCRDLVEPTSTPVKSSYLGPRGFFWLWPGQLGGTPRPGIVGSPAEDLAGLKRLDVTRIVTLEETETVPAELLQESDIACYHFPIDDMTAPEIERALDFCSRVDSWLCNREVVAFHCRAGLGRTGTLLAAQIIWRGRPAHYAIDEVRKRNPRCIQSDEQITFLREFERAVAVKAAPSSRTVNE